MPTRQRVQDRTKLVRNTLVELSDFEQTVAHFIADARNANSRKENVKDMKQDKKRTSVEIDQDGAEAELAFYKLLEEYPTNMFDVSSKSKAKGTDSGDAVVDGFVVDVKTTRYKTGKLIQGGGVKEPVVDMYCLMIKVAPHTFQLKGFYPARMLISEEKYGKHMPGRPCFMAEQKELMDYDDCVKKVLDLR